VFGMLGYYEGEKAEPELRAAPAGVGSSSGTGSVIRVGPREPGSAGAAVGSACRETPGVIRHVRGKRA